MANYTTKEKHELLAKFYYMDIDGDGELDRDEILKCLKDSHLPSDRIEEFLNLFDADGDGRVTLDEYERALGLKEVPQTAVEDWKRAFEEMDTDNSGTLTVTEIYEGLRRAGMAVSLNDIREIIESVDSDGDQKLTLSEFTALMRLNS